MEYLDGRKSFVFSWNTKHRKIHEEALLHYFDPNRKRQKFEPKAATSSMQSMDKVTTEAEYKLFYGIDTTD